jgi:anti-sigma factor RsiW
MSECDSLRNRIGLYLDDELRDADLADFEEHLSRCSGCDAAVKRERSLIDAVRASGPIYSAPPELRERASGILNGGPARYGAPPGFRERLVRDLVPALRPRSGPRAAAALVVVAVLVAAGVWVWRRGASTGQPSALALMAVDSHLRRVGGQLPFEITSESPEEISRWFSGKVPFDLTLPNYQESSGQERRYSLEGARLVALDNDYAAYIGYRMGSQPISLIITAAKGVQPTGGIEIVAKGIHFHYDQLSGLKVITWGDRGLIYALVSSLEERGEQSCIVCHEGAKDPDFMEGLKSTN